MESGKIWRTLGLVCLSFLEDYGPRPGNNKALRFGAFYGL